MGIPKTHEVDLWNRALSRVGDSRIEFVDAAVAVDSVDALSPVEVITIAAHGYSTDDRVLLYDLTGGTEVNGRVFAATNFNATTIRLQREDGTLYAAGTGGFLRRLPNTKIVRTCFDAWPRVRDEIIRAHPWNSIVRRTRLSRLQAVKTITGATAASPCVITAAAHGYSSGDLVLITGIVGMTELNDRYYTITVLTADTFSIPIDSTTYTAYGSGGNARKALTPLTPDFGYSYKYDLPDDCERVLELAEDPDYGWETEGRQVLTDLGITVQIRYARKITDPELFDAQLTTVLVARLALEISEELAQSNSKKQELKDDYDGLRSEAKRLDAQEQSGQDFAEDDWVNARL